MRKPPRPARPDRTWLAPLLGGAVAAGVLTLVFVYFAESLRAAELMAFDTAVSAWVQGYRHPALTPWMERITFWGTPLGFTIAAVLASNWLYRRHRRTRETLALLGALLGGWGIDELLKATFQRPRPETGLVQASGFSFPSGHAMVGMAFYGMLGYLIWCHLPRGRRRWVAPVTALFVIAVGLSRIYLGVHYPSDVVAGFAAGGAWLAICIAASRAAR